MIWHKQNCSIVKSTVTKQFTSSSHQKITFSAHMTSMKTHVHNQENIHTYINITLANTCIILPLLYTAKQKRIKGRSGDIYIYISVVSLSYDILQSSLPLALPFLLFFFTSFPDCAGSLAPPSWSALFGITDSSPCCSC